MIILKKAFHCWTSRHFKNIKEHFLLLLVKEGANELVGRRGKEGGCGEEGKGGFRKELCIS